ncbi:MAG: Crp/Fnr family transcriptional regulator [Magnetospirillum sp.]
MRDFSFFRQMTPSGQDILSRGHSRHLFTKGAVPVNKGQSVSGAYFVLSGQLRVFTLSPAGREATLYQIAPGETCVLALNCLFNDLLYPAWVQAEDDSEVAVVGGATYRTLFETERPIQQLTVKALSTIVFRLMDELEQIHSCRLDQRLAQFLLRHANATGCLAMTQQEIAGHMGTTREVVARLMADFAAKAWVETTRGRVNVLDPAALTRLAVP